MVEVNFRNVNITIVNAKDAKDAYRKLDALLSSDDVGSWESDTYVIWLRPGEPLNEQPTTGLDD